MRSAIFTLSVCLFGIVAAHADTLQAVMSSDEIRDELSGVYLEGVAGIDDSPWSECIEPNGNTVYQYQGVQLLGKLSVRASGLACFDYGERKSPLQNCFAVMRQENGGYLFSGGATNGGQFATKSVRRNVNSCPSGPPAIS